MSDYYILTELEQFVSKISRFKYLCCALYANKVAFGASAGSVHLYSLTEASSPIVVSIPSIVTAIQLLSFSPGGKFLAVGGNSSLHFIEDPLTNPVVSYSVDLKGKRPTTLDWISEPPPKISRTPFLLIGDETGGVWTVRHQSADYITTVNSPIVQLQYISEESILVSAKSSPCFIKAGNVVNIRGKKVTGDFGSLYSPTHNAIFFSKPESTLLIASPEGKPQAKIVLAEHNTIPETFSSNLSYLLLCSTFLISVGPNCLAYIVNLNNGTPEGTIIPNSEYCDFSSYKNYALLMWKDKLTLFKACESNEEYYRYLVDQKQYEKAQELAMHDNVKDMKLLKLMEVNPSEKFEQYLQKVDFESQPQPLQAVDPEFYGLVTSLDVPDTKTIEKLKSMLQQLALEPEVVSKVRNYVIKNPNEYFNWEKFLNPDDIVSNINSSPENSQIVTKIAAKGSSQLCRMLASISSFDISILVANSPPIYLHNVDEQRKSLFIDMMAKKDVFSAYAKKEEPEEILVESPYAEKIKNINPEKVTPFDVMSLLKLNEWEQNITNEVTELCNLAERYNLSREDRGIPPWVDQMISAEKSEISFDQNAVKSTAGNWGVRADLSVCQVCGLPLNLGENTTSAATFPCGHTFHISCLKTRYCPSCYSNKLK
ncbi:hypothetical protein TVAG_160560 [Trichomonas vaginalis G3]|uniref:RING-type domain-containing protein n=1 Tax=Trichomonas vaginalis (strain ATCC PRA-98 / G3) TaxID=412133 RepID=A2GAK2_TRIV3|nr:DPP6 N-terminal domain-like family [Trichomonas vaginalis G3]EAX85814.1 hypothetical protein TVAG_160560 [Trichomonas vaginalis G3]KAI5485491.1 DPP6 N-terminal domain-like family [Trichomonas vaginalis G3]|eukprot:XP_001298744.1 hypothetical protein [Trichomonas vaginalis G3]